MAEHETSESVSQLLTPTTPTPTTPSKKRSLALERYLEATGSNTPSPSDSKSPFNFDRNVKKIIKTFPLRTAKDKPCPLFTGRVDVLKKLHSHIMTTDDEKDCKAIKVTLLTGLRGSGKSEVVRKYIDEYRSHHRNIALLNAESKENLIKSFIGLVQHFQICQDILEGMEENGGKFENSKVKQIIVEVYNHFATHIKKGMFILDGARPWCPEVNLGEVNDLDNNGKETQHVNNCENVQQNSTESNEKNSDNANLTPKVNEVKILKLTPVEATESENFSQLSDFLPLPSLTPDLHTYPLFLITTSKSVSSLNFPPSHDIFSLTTFELPGMLPIENLELFRKIVKLPTATSRTIRTRFDPDCPLNKAIMQLTLTFGEHPFAVSLAASSISEKMKHQVRGQLWDQEDLENLRSEVESFMEDFRHKDQQWMDYYPPKANDLGQNYEGHTIRSIWRETLDPLLNPDGQSELHDLMNLVAFLPSQKINAELCYLLQNKIKINSKIRKQFPPEKLSNLMRQFKKLEENHMVSIRIESVQLNLNYFHQLTCTSEIQVHPLVQKVWREILKEINNPEYNKILIDVAQWLSDNIKFVPFTPFLETMQGFLEENKWPGESFKFYLQFALRGQNSENMIQKLYNEVFRNAQHPSCGDEEYKKLCEIILVLKKNENNLKSKEKRENSLEIELDNTALVGEDNELRKITGKRFLEWSMEQMSSYGENLLMQEVGSGIVQIYVCNEELMKDEGIKEKVKKWLDAYRELIKRKDLRLSYNSDKVAIDVFGIARKIWEPSKLVKTAIEVMEGREEDSEEFNCGRYFAWTISQIPEWRRDLWLGTEGLTSKDLDEALAVRNQFMEANGLTIVTKILNGVDSADDGVLFVLRELFQIVQDLSFCEKTGRAILDCEEFCNFLTEFLRWVVKDEKDEDVDEVLKSAFAVTGIITWTAIVTGQNELPQIFLDLMTEEGVVTFLSILEVKLRDGDFSQKFNEHFLVLRRKNSWLRILEECLKVHQKSLEGRKELVLESIRQLQRTLEPPIKIESAEEKIPYNVRNIPPDVPDTCTII